MAGEYARYRPLYPDQLFAYLASIAPGHHLAWDCGTGNGQAAIKLAQFFDQVIATDASSDQLANAIPHQRVIYRVEAAEEPGLAPGTVELVTVATAVHWFDLPRFYQTVQQVAAPGGVLAVWCYHLPVIEPAVDRLLVRFYQDILAGYWPERFHYLDEKYRTLPFPFKELDPPGFEMQSEWDLDQLAGFLDSWSGSQRYRAAQGHSPLEPIWSELLEAWGDRCDCRLVRWPLHMRVGRVKPVG